MPTLGTTVERPSQGSAIDPFALWAEVYDDQPNPLLSLEEEFLPSLFPHVQGLDVVDLGCGTGRWLQRLAGKRPRSLIGIDSSREMIARAAAKVGGHAVLLRADCGSASLLAGSADLCLASFVLSHVPHLQSFVRQLSYMLRSGGTAFITDVHPETSGRCGWKRAFQHEGQSISLQTYERPIQEVIAALREHGFKVSALLEPCFQIHQQRILAEHNVPLDPSTLRSPAIYILQIQYVGTACASAREPSSVSMRIAGSRIAFGPRASACAQLTVSHSRVDSINSSRLHQRSTASPMCVDLSGYLLLPGLINSHDHLEFGLFPSLGRGGYRNAAEWADDIQHREAAVIAQHRRVPKPVRCWWGAIRNLLCGVTIVCHHNPLLDEFSTPDFPVRVLHDYEWAHSLTFDSVERTKLDLSKPFIIHAGEGVDEASAEEVTELHRRGLLSDRTVLVHSLALREGDISLLNECRASVVWCPSSNRFLFGRTLSRDLLSRIHSLALGSDSALTSGGDLIDDICFASRETGISSERLYSMLYAEPARIFHMHDGQGSIRPGGVADLIAIRDRGLDPAEAVAQLSSTPVEMVLLRGQVQLARNSVMERLPQELRVGLEPLQVDGETVRVRAPMSELFASAVTFLDNPLQVGGKRVALCP
jgi:cytosine/adenosine deaminase-related metal-dependent hydrolase/ubiquinone/menaquinone biosynthesis C-methylase UbiE